MTDEAVVPPPAEDSILASLHDVLHAGTSANVAVVVALDPSPDMLNRLVIAARELQDAAPGTVHMLTTQDDPSRDWIIGQPGATCIRC